MPTFSKPSTFYELRRTTPTSRYTVSDMSGILADHVRTFLEAPAAYVGLSSTSVLGLIGALIVYTDPDKLLQSGSEDWIFITPGPSPVKSNQHLGLADIGALIQNSSAPRPMNDMNLMRFQGGMLSSKGLLTVQRTLLISICAGTRAGTFRAADALYLWLSDMLGILRLELNCDQVNLAPVQVPGEAERPLFSGFAGNPAIIPISVMSIRTNTRSISNPI